MLNISEEDLKKQVDEALSGGVGPKVARFALAVLSGAIPIVGGVIGGAGSAWSEKEEADFNRLLRA